MGNEDLSDQLTIILTLKDRSAFTYRWMEWMNENRCPYKILIADGGADKEIEEHLKDYSNYPYLNYEYIRYPYDENFEVFYAKLANITSKVKTKYMLMADNDDFYYVETFSALIEFLEQNNEYVSCGGATANLTLLENKQAANQTTASSYDAVMIYSSSIESNNPIQRLLHFFEYINASNFFNLYYCIHRTDIFHNNMKTSVNISPKDVIVLEFMILFLLIQAGKVKIFDKVIYIRQQATSQSSAAANTEGGIFERLFETNSFSQLHTGIEENIKFSNKLDRTFFYKSLAKWFINDTCKEVSSRRIGTYLPRYTSIWFIARNLQYSFYRMKSKKAKKIIKLPLIEPYILRKP